MVGSQQVVRMGVVKNPYLNGTDRLADILMAIQFLGTYRFYKVSFDYWQKRAKSSPRSASSWMDIFTEHPEFFRVSTVEEDQAEDENEVVDDGNGESRQNRVCLILRRARPKNFHVDTGEIVTDRTQRARDKERISRAPLAPDDLAVLLNAAIEMHGRDLAHRQERRWFVPVVTSLAGGMGAAIGAIIGAILGPP